MKQSLDNFSTDKQPASDENDLIIQIFFHKDIWAIDLSKKDSQIRAFVQTFLMLGYIIYFLPRSGMSLALVRACQKPTFLTELVASFFPTRTARLRWEMKNYLERM